MPDIEASIWQPFQSQGVLVFGLQSGEQPQQLADFITQTGITFPVLEANNTLGKFAFPPGVQYPFPRDIVIDKTLKVRAIRNSFNPGELEALVVQLLAE